MRISCLICFFLVLYRLHFQLYTYTSIVFLFQLDNEIIDVTLGYTDPDGRFSIQTDGLQAMLSTQFGLVVHFDGDLFVQVALPAAVRGHVDGMCRDFNGDSQDEYTVDGVDYSGNASRDSIMGSLFQASDNNDAE